MENNFKFTQYLISRKVLKFFGAEFKIFDTEGNLQFFVNQKAFKLKEDIRVYSDETMQNELLLIKARKNLDIASEYDVYDSKTNEKIGVLKRKGLKSIFKDEWIIMDSQDNEVGRIKEDSVFKALLRRILTNLIPQTFEGFIGESKVFTFKQKFNPFIQKIVLDFSEDQINMLDRRLGICAGILLCAIEGRQN